MSIEINEDTKVYTDKFQMYIDLFLDDNKFETIDNQFHWNACMMYIYRNVFKPDHNLRDNRKCIIPYQDINTFIDIHDTYIYYSTLYKRNPTLDGFLKLTGMNKQTIYNLSNGNDELSLQWLDLLKKFHDEGQQALDNRLFDSNNVTGQLGLANHYYGYNLPGVSRERSQDAKPLGASQLPKLSLSDGHNTMIETKD